MSESNVLVRESEKKQRPKSNDSKEKSKTYAKSNKKNYSNKKKPMFKKNENAKTEDKKVEKKVETKTKATNKKEVKSKPQTSKTRNTRHTRNTKNSRNSNQRHAEKKLRIIPLGGLNEIGKNITMYEYGDEAILIDCGMTFPENELYGIDVVIPDLTYVKKNVDKIKGLLITHGHEDHIGAIPYLLKEVNIPIYGTRLTLGLVENKLKEHKLLKGTKLNVIQPDARINFGSFNVEPISVSHSIPDAVGYCVETPYGNIIHTGDFKIDFNPINGQKTDLNKFAQYGQRGVLALFADSTNATRPGYTMSESTVGDTIEEIFRHSDSRIIVASFASNVDRVQQIVNAAAIFGRKVAFSGRSMVNVSNIARDLGYLKGADDIFIDINDIHRYPENEICVITTGSQGEPLSALARMANSEHRKMEIVPGDLVILSASPIPGNEKSVSRIINLLSQKGANVIYESLADVHVSGHAKQEELKIMHSLVKPKYFIPIHGEYNHLKHHVDLAVSMGMNENNIFILQNGSVLEFDSKGCKLGPKVHAGRVFVDGLGVGDVGNIVLRDRKHLAEDGLIIVVATLDKETGMVISGPDIVSRGFVYVRESELLMSGARKVLDKALNKCTNENIKDWASMKNEVKTALSDYIYQQTKRNPMILPIFMEIDQTKE